MSSPGLSVVLPTLNCADVIQAHIRSMESWLDLAGEVIVVDSDSTDGTVDLIRENIEHPNLSILNHPRGLYQSWNHAISQTRGKWIYISTIGDTITRDQLEHLINAGDTLNADVVSSPPQFVFDTKIKMTTPIWPISHILEFHQVRTPTVIDSIAAFYHVLIHLPNAIIGSSASNVYRGSHLRSRPFPTNLRMIGDTAWALRFAMETRFCYTCRIGSVFRFHSDTYLKPEFSGIPQLINLLQTEGRSLLEARLTSDNSEVLKLLNTYFDNEIDYHEARTKFKTMRRKSIIPWFFRPSMINLYKSYKRLKLDTTNVESLLKKSLRQLPVESSSHEDHGVAGDQLQRFL